MKILITGGSGFIGRNLIEQLNKEYNIISTSRKELDLMNQKQVEYFLQRERFDIIIHAANCNNVVHKLSSFDILDGNLRMFYNLERCHNFYGKLYYFGSGAEFDMENYIPNMDEGYFGKFIPKDPYGFSKYTMCKICENSKNIYNLRLFGVFGKYEEWQRRFISNAICRNIKGIPITINQNVYFDYLYVDDLVSIVKWFIEHNPKHNIYNICTGTSRDLKSLAQDINIISNKKSQIIVKNEGIKPEYTGSNKKLKNEIPNINFTNTNDAIKKLYQYYTDNEQIIDINKL